MAEIKFDPLAPFENKQLLDELLEKFKTFKYKLYGKREIKFYRGEPDKYEFDLNIGRVHFTELDFQGISKFIKETNDKWKTKITYCIYISKENELIINVRSPKAPNDME